MSGDSDEESDSQPSDATLSAVDTHSTAPKSGAEATHTLLQRLELLVIAGPDAGRRCQSRGEHTIIGKHELADLILSDTSVSRFHAEVVLRNGRVVVRDLGSRNGVLLDGVAIIEALPRHGSIVALGNTQLRIDLTPDHVAVPLSKREQFGTMVGRSPAMRAVFHALERCAESESTVLLEGDTGTGKEAAAESIHLESARRDGPFVVVDCGSIPPDLLESELFGHEKGAFTGAVAMRKGAFESADGGTIFLDEIGELSADLQPKLLRALERFEVKRVGGDKHARVDVRVIAATNRDLRGEVNAKRFRSDLFYRLAVLRVRLPALRERMDDMPLLVDNVLTRLRNVVPADVDWLRSPAFMAHLASHAWPGNVRELRNYIESCHAMRTETPFGDPAGAADSLAGDTVTVDPTIPLKTARDVWVRHFERKYLAAILAVHGDNVTAAARAADLARPYFYRLLSRYGLR